MKPQKVFVRYKNLNETPSYPRERAERTDKKPYYQKKKYAEKNNARPREPFRIIYQSFQPSSSPNAVVQKLSSKYPSFFNPEGKPPQKQSNDLLNQYLIFNTKKFLESLREPRKEPQHIISQSDPDWNSDEDIDDNLESKVIEEKVVEKVVQKMKDRPIRKPDTLKPHQKRFLEQYFRNKRTAEQEANTNINTNQTNPKETPKGPEKEAGKLKVEEKKEEGQKQGSIWSDYQQRQVSTFVDMGFMEKIEENDYDEPIEAAEDDGLFDQSGSEGGSPKNSNKSDSDEEDDIFGDDDPTTTTVKTKEEPQEVTFDSEKKITGTVFIKEHVFSQIAEAVGLLPARCNWIIKNDFNKYKVSTDYMDAYYRKEKMSEMFPYVSLNHSPFVSNSKIGTPEALEQFRDFNHRKNQQGQYGIRQRLYKEKHSHLKKK